MDPKDPKAILARQNDGVTSGNKNPDGTPSAGVSGLLDGAGLPDGALEQLGRALAGVLGGSEPDQVADALAFAVGALPGAGTSGWRSARVQGANRLWRHLPDVAQAIGSPGPYRTMEGIRLSTVGSPRVPSEWLPLDVAAGIVAEVAGAEQPFNTAVAHWGVAVTPPADGVSVTPPADEVSVTPPADEVSTAPSAAQAGNVSDYLHSPAAMWSGAAAGVAAAALAAFLLL